MIGRFANKLLRPLGLRLERNIEAPPESEPDPLVVIQSSISTMIRHWPAGGLPMSYLHEFERLKGLPIEHPIADIPHAFFASCHNTYAPWLLDEEFLQLVGQTLLDEFRCWTIWSTLKQLKDLRGDVIEIGVYKGGSAQLIAAAVRNEETNVYACDTFAGVVKAGAEDTFYRGGEHADTTIAEVQSLLDRQVSKSRAHILQGIFPEDTGAAVANRTFKFAHVDVDVYQGTIDIVDFLWPRICAGGVIVVDDYALQATEGVTKAVADLRSRHHDLIFIFNFNGQAMLIKQIYNVSSAPLS